ncbi:uncharacterized protein LOC106644129, partial [Copidosoma floridanum]|uniref:uncharacterized protein LOC106644129 n=1 Tax=Copidosoma floridanum TaxID=29053 RepID=UPI0006C9525B
EEFLTASQLVSEQDFFYTAQQEATSFYETNSPVWYSIAAGNWQLVGELVRKLAADSANDLHVWSGTIDVLKLPDRRGCPRNIYLAEDSQGRQLIPVPKLLYKYVYDCHRHRGLVLITVNDPHLVYGITNDMILCPELHVCQELNPNFRSVKRGFTYCCNLQGFAPIARALDLPTFPGAAPLHA